MHLHLVDSFEDLKFLIIVTKVQERTHDLLLGILG